MHVRGGDRGGVADGLGPVLVGFGGGEVCAVGGEHGGGDARGGDEVVAAEGVDEGCIGGAVGAPGHSGESGRGGESFKICCEWVGVVVEAFEYGRGSHG